MLAIELLQVFFDVRQSLSRVHSVSEWQQCYDFADMQAVIGVLFAAIKRLPKEQRPVLDQLLDWVGQSEYMSDQGAEMDSLIRSEAARIRAFGMKCVVLKGRGLARMYDHGVRTTGDVDIWAMADRQTICRYCRENVKDYNPAEDGSLHTSYMLGDVVVEMHFTPTYLSSPKYGKVLEKWIAAYEARPDNIVEVDGIPVPTLDFNLVYLMLHMYRHYLFEGIGLRHLVDYMVVLAKADAEQKAEVYHVLRSLGADRFAGAVLWVATECLGLKDAALAECPLDERRGRMLWDAILVGGNFGKSDVMNSHKYRTAPLRRMWRFVSRNSSLVCAYPGEILGHVFSKIKFIG